MLGEVERLDEQGDALGFARDAKAAREPGGARMLAQDRKPERMEGVDRDLRRSRGSSGRQPLAHFRGGAAREGDGEAMLRRDAALGDEMGDAMGQRAGLAGAGTGDDQQRSVDGFRRRALVRIELGENAGRWGSSIGR